MRNAEEILKDKEYEIVSVSPETTISEALQLMIKNQIGAMLIEDKEEIVGIWTERDLMRNTVAGGFDPNTAKIGDYMTTGLLSAPHDNTCYELLDKFLGMRLRHLLITKEEKYIGLVSIGDVIKSCLQAKDEELRKLNKYISWEFYENWGWRKK